MLSRFLKRIFDLVFALLAAILLAPVFLLAALMVKLFSPEAPVLFKQRRIGHKNRPFIIYKLRSMSDQRDENGVLLPDEQRLKPWGKILRASNLDELPQIYHIILGQMSWIGPRPLLPQEMQVMLPEEQELRQSMPPGISGWEAVNEGKSQNRRQMAEFDLYYVRNWSLLFDLKIFFKTLFIVLLKLRPADALRAPKLSAQEIISADSEPVTPPDP